MRAHMCYRFGCKERSKVHSPCTSTHHPPDQLKDPKRLLQLLPGQYSLPCTSPTTAPDIQDIGSTKSDDEDERADVASAPVPATALLPSSSAFLVRNFQKLWNMRCPIAAFT